MAFSKEERAEWRRRTKHASDKKYAEAHKEQISAYKARYYQENKQRILTKSKQNRVLRLYGLTSDEYQRKLQDQGHRCGICRTNIWELGFDLAVDHDHQTGQVRALLCLLCNTGLGSFKEDPVLLLNAAEYLKREW